MGEKIELIRTQEETYGKKLEHVNYSKTTLSRLLSHFEGQESMVDWQQEME